MDARRRKRNGLVGESLLGGKSAPSTSAETPMTLVTEAAEMFLMHARVHSPDKPRTAQRYGAGMDYMKRLPGKKMFIEAVTRPDIDDYKAARSTETSEQHKDRPITARTINYEISVLRTFFYFLIRERNVPTTNPCPKFKQLKDPRVKAKRRPPTYRQEESDRIFAACDAFEKTIFATLLLTGLRTNAFHGLT